MLMTYIYVIGHWDDFDRFLVGTRDDAYIRHWSFDWFRLALKGLNNDTVKNFKVILKEEMTKVNDKLEGKIHQLCQDKR